MRGGVSLARTWIVVTSLWTVSDLLRIEEHQARCPGCPSAFEAWPAWLGLLVPPLVLALVLAMIQLASGPLPRPWDQQRDRRPDERR